MPVTQVLHNGPVKVLKNSEDGLLDPRGSLANEVPSHAIQQASQSMSAPFDPFTNEMASIYTGNGGNHEYHTQNTLNSELCMLVCICKINSVY